MLACVRVWRADGCWGDGIGRLTTEPVPIGSGCPREQLWCMRDCSGFLARHTHFYFPGGRGIGMGDPTPWQDIPGSGLEC